MAAHPIVQLLSLISLLLAGLHLHQQKQLDGLPSNNCINERDLSKFDKEAYVAKCRNRRFKAKNIRNNMVLYKAKKSQRIDRISKEIMLMLAERERAEVGCGTKEEAQ